MNFCSNCGAQLEEENQQFCSNCGTKLCADPLSENNSTISSQTAYTQQQVMQNQIYRTQNINIMPSMSWFKFLINFALIAGAVLNFAYGITYISGDIYNIQTDGKVTAEMIYSLFDGLKTVDVFFGAAMIILGGFCIFTRFRLSRYRKDGPLFLYILCGVNIGLSLIYSITVMSISDLNQLPTLVSQVIIQVAMIISNVKYFDKRKNLFIN